MELPQTGRRPARRSTCSAPRPGTTLIADSTSVCFYKLAAAALAARPGRSTIITDTDNFPTDRYIVEGLAAQTGRRSTGCESDPRTGPQPEQVEPIARTPSDVALVTFSHVSYRSAQIADMHDDHASSPTTPARWCCGTSATPPARCTRQLDANDVDLAVGCTYKYLNGGPGAPAFLYVDERLQHELRQPIWGWLGRADPFEMGPGYEPAPGHHRASPPARRRSSG